MDLYQNLYQYDFISIFLYGIYRKTFISFYNHSDFNAYFMSVKQLFKNTVEILIENSEQINFKLFNKLSKLAEIFVFHLIILKFTELSCFLLCSHVQISVCTATYAEMQFSQKTHENLPSAMSANRRNCNGIILYNTV